MRVARRSPGPAAAAIASLLLAACGARSGLEVDPTRDASTAVPEDCDGADDDGDGRVDEGIAPIACGEGACRAEIPGCVAGAIPTCTPRPPAAETCNALDDDCDGRTDEGLGLDAIGDPIVVRGEGDFGSDRCSTCRVAFAPDVVATGAGMLVTWRLGFLGTAPEPNTFARLLDDAARPIAPIALLFDRDTTQGPRSTPSAGGGVALVHCGRTGADDVTTSALLDARGALVREEARSPTDRSCGAWPPSAIWSGRRHFFAWTDNSSGPIEGFEVLLDLADASGTSVDWQMLEPNGGSSPSLALAHDRVLLVVETRPEPRRSVLAVHRFTLDGAPAGAPIHVELPEGADDAWTDPQVVATASGWIVHAASARREGGRFVVRLAPDGSLAAPPRRIDDGTRYGSGFDDVIARRGGGALIASPVDGDGYAVLAVDDEGDAIDAWRADPGLDRGTAWGALIEHRARIFMAYVALLGENRAEVRIRELGCRDDRAPP